MPGMTLLPLNSCEVKGGRDSSRCGEQRGGWAIMALRALFFITLLLLADAQKWPATGDCRPCECRYKVTSFGRVRTVNCSRRGLGTIPSNLPKDLMALDLSWNSLDVEQLRVHLCKFQSLQFVSLAFAGITSLSDILKECSSVLELNLTGNRLGRVDSKTFTGLRNLRRLLGLEVETVVARDTFQPLTSLKDLDVIFHGVSLPKGLFDDLVIQSLNLVVTQAISLPQQVFQFGQNTLNTLQLIGERITEVDEDLLDGLRVLKKLYLVLPSVGQLPKGFFHSQQFQPKEGLKNMRLTNLQEVEISGIRNLPAMLFNKLVTLETLQLKNIGHFPQMGFLAGAINLRTLLVTGSTMTSLPEGWFNQLYSLERLTLSGIQLERLHENAFRGLISLNYLDLSNNKLNQITAKMLMPLNKTLETLVLRGNSLTEINRDVLGKLNSLRLLDVSENRLTNVYTESFMGMTYLTVLYLNNNHLTSLPKDLFKDLLQLESLYLSNNNLVEFPEAVLQLSRSLMDLDLASNELSDMPAVRLCQFVYLENINILGNKLHCDCSLLAFHQCRKIAVEGQCSSPLQFKDMHIGSVPVPASCLEGENAKQKMSNPQSQQSSVLSTTQSVVAVVGSIGPLSSSSSGDTPEGEGIPQVKESEPSTVKTDPLLSGIKPTQNETIVRRLFTERLKNRLKNTDSALLNLHQTPEDKSYKSVLTQKEDVKSNKKQVLPQAKDNAPFGDTITLPSERDNTDSIQKSNRETEDNSMWINTQNKDQNPPSNTEYAGGILQPNMKDSGKQKSQNSAENDQNQKTNNTETLSKNRGQTKTSKAAKNPDSSNEGVSVLDNKPKNATQKLSHFQGEYSGSDFSSVDKDTSSQSANSQTTANSERDDAVFTKKTVTPSSVVSSSGEIVENKRTNDATSTATARPPLEEIFGSGMDEKKMNLWNNKTHKDPEEEEIGNNEKKDEEQEKTALNFIISALAALSMFGCAMLGLVFVRRWQQKGTYILSNEETEMNNLDICSMEATAAIPIEKLKAAEVV